MNLHSGNAAYTDTEILYATLCSHAGVCVLPTSKLMWTEPVVFGVDANFSYPIFIKAKFPGTSSRAKSLPCVENL